MMSRNAFSRGRAARLALAAAVAALAVTLTATLAVTLAAAALASCSRGPEAPSIVAGPDAGLVFGEFEDATLLAQARAARPETRSWSERELRDGLSGATIQAKTFGKAVPDRLVLIGGRVVARADGFGQYWLALPPGEYELVGRCRGYRDAKATAVVGPGSTSYLNFYLERP